MLNRRIQTGGEHGLGGHYHIRTRSWLYWLWYWTFSRKIVGWSAGPEHARRDGVVQCSLVQRSTATRSDRPRIAGSVRQPGYRALLARRGNAASIVKKGNYWDNSVMERFFLGLKMGRYGAAITPTTPRRCVTSRVHRWVYNLERLHSKLGYLPTVYERAMALKPYQKSEPVDPTHRATGAPKRTVMTRATNICVTGWSRFETQSRVCASERTQSCSSSRLILVELDGSPQGQSWIHVPASLRFLASCSDNGVASFSTSRRPEINVTLSGDQGTLGYNYGFRYSSRWRTTYLSGGVKTEDIKATPRIHAGAAGKNLDRPL
jgi:hypothetical protein